MDLEFGQQMYFLLSSIKDIQATIRAIDTKVSILLAALAIPLPQLAVFFAYWHARGFSVSVAHIVMALAVALYVLAVYVAVKTLVGIGDATPHIRGVKMMNTFYAGGMFGLDWRDSLRDRPGVQSSKTVDEYIGSLPTSQETMKEEACHRNDGAGLHPGHQTLPSALSVYGSGFSRRRCCNRSYRVIVTLNVMVRAGLTPFCHGRAYENVSTPGPTLLAAHTKIC